MRSNHIRDIAGGVRAISPLFKRLIGVKLFELVENTDCVSPASFHADRVAFEEAIAEAEPFIMESRSFLMARRAIIIKLANMNNADDQRRMKSLKEMNQDSLPNQANLNTMDGGASAYSEGVSSIVRHVNKHYSRYAASCPSGTSKMIDDGGNLDVNVSDAAVWSSSGSATRIIRDTDGTVTAEDRGLNC